MTLLDRLLSGDAGVQLRPPPGWILLDQGERGLLAQDPERGVGWQLDATVSRLSLADEPLLREQADAEARILFEESFTPRGGDPQQDAPRTQSQPGWSPLVDLAAQDAPGGRLLRIVHRLTYRAGDEVIAGRILVPVQGGMVELTCLAKADATGARESVLMLKREREGGPLAPLTQAEYDDPKHDALLPSHPLSRIRAAQAWLLDPAGGALRVTAPDPGEAGEIALPEADCAITPPPRFLRLPAGALPLSASLAMFTRVSLSTTRNPAMLDVWRYPDRTLDPRDGAALRALAHQAALGFAREGVLDLAVDTQPAPGPGGRVGARCSLTFRVHGRPVRAAHRWFTDADGSAFRVSASDHASFPAEALEALADAAIASWRRLSPPPAKPWWKLW